MSSETDDLFNLNRFLTAQSHEYEQAVSEIRSGRKQSHWMWYIFPQYVGLGSSRMSRLYAIRNVAEAEAYLRHPVLGLRLVACAEATLAIEGRSAHEMFQSPDDLKLRSCATLFAHISSPGSIFHRLIEKFFQGRPDPATLREIGIHDKSAR